ncbi:hypothetical protein H5410_014047 [Solanum commersonii]|uniref:Uncharacterized protein n=1 Tax=Solanum commersonii TaxID=4109 RepID=A0A9J5ZQA5_SOLCO|nr:hypothetical protein H5410_014047 [Solanum commersonii]
MEVAKLRMLRWMCGILGETRLGMKKSGTRRSVDALVRRRERLAMVGIKRGRDNLKKYWWEVIRQDKVHLGFTGNMTLDRRV